MPTGLRGAARRRRRNMSTPDEIRKMVSREYGRLVKDAREGCCALPGCGAAAAALAGYGEEELGNLPPGTGGSSFGCGNPVASSGIGKGDTVLDLGSGTGLDLLVAARRAGPSGRVIGVDMTAEMLERARQAVAAAGFENVEVLEGVIEDLPVEASSVDWVISNCVINLSPEKDKVFAEIFRVLRPGGRMIVSDIVVEDLPGWVRSSGSLYCGCIGGALSEEEYLEGLARAGLTEVEVRDRLVYDAEQLRAFLQLEVTGSTETDPCSCGDYLAGRLLGRAAEILEGKVRSALFFARKPH